MMKVFEKPSLLIICSFVLGYLGIVLPVTRMHYQVVTNSHISTGETVIVSSQGFSSLFSNRYGEGHLLFCLNGFAGANSSSDLNRLRPFWEFLGRGLTVVVFASWMSYIIQRKLSLVKFTFLLVLFFGVSIAGSILLSQDEPVCNPNTQYQLIAFVPFLPTFVFLICGILCGYRASHLTNAVDATVSGIGAGNLQT